MSQSVKRLGCKFWRSGVGFDSQQDWSCISSRLWIASRHTTDHSHAIKWPRREAEKSTPPSTWNKNMWSYISTNRFKTWLTINGTECETSSILHFTHKLIHLKKWTWTLLWTYIPRLEFKMLLNYPVLNIFDVSFVSGKKFRRIL
jgi:hypothetical protein